ncbi:MAG: DDE-type integrase/transposase/recombinase [Candidatus Methanomethylicia archaeon]
MKFRAILEAKEWEKPKKHLTIAIDETCLKLKGEKFWVYAAIDVDTKELVEIGAYPTRSSLATRLFLQGVLNKCLTSRG